MAVTRTSRVQRASVKMGHKYLRWWVAMADLYLQCRIRLQECCFQWRILPAGCTSGTLHSEPDLCRLGGEGMGVVCGHASARHRHLDYQRWLEHAEKLHGRQWSAVSHVAGTSKSASADYSPRWTYNYGVFIAGNAYLYNYVSCLTPLCLRPIN